MERCLGCCFTIGSRRLPRSLLVEPLYIAAKVVNVAPKPKQTAKPKPKPPAQVSETVSQAIPISEPPATEPESDEPQSLNIPRIQSMSWLKLRAMRTPRSGR